MSAVDFPVKPEARPYLGAFREARGEPEWLGRERRLALARFAEQGFPSRRGESWRYLDLRRLERKPLLPAGTPGGEASSALLDEIALPGARHRLVLADGRFAPGLSSISGLPRGVWLSPTGVAVEKRSELLRRAFEATTRDREHPFAALNGAFFTDGFVLDVAPGVVVTEPIEIVHLASSKTSGSLHTRSLVVLGERSRVRLIEGYVGSGHYWRNAVTGLRLAGGSALDHVTLVEESDEALHLASTEADLGAAARLGSVILLLGGATARHEVCVRSAGEGACCGLYGAFVAAGRQQCNIVTAVDHLAPRGETREIFKGVAAGRAHGAFQGRITVRPGAQKIDAHMLSRNLTLGTQAAIDTKPELEIFADDVKCSHGAAVGDLDAAALFYLASRGIPRREARQMLIEAFAREVVETIEPEALREHLLARLARRLRLLEEST